MAIILAIETSCDDTSVAVLESGKVLSNIIASQAIHNEWGGIVPELASREHISNISQTTRAALVKSGKKIEDIEAVAVTHKPGLSGSLIVGTSFAKGLALSLKIPIYPIDHIEGHLYSAAIESTELEFPFISLVVSGGHTSIFDVRSFDEYKVLGSTIDDAAGEAYDKTAKLLGLGYPGGPIIDELAQKGDANFYSFPRPLLREKNLNFSFSGLKTSVRYYVKKHYPESVGLEKDIPNLCASVQAAINEVLVLKTIRAAKTNGITNITINGGVSANSDLRNRFMSIGEANNLKVFFPSLEYSIDNAAMIGFLADARFSSGNKDLGNDFRFRVNSIAIRSRKD